jgi:hypothetical protein
MSTRGPRAILALSQRASLRGAGGGALQERDAAGVQEEQGRGATQRAPRSVRLKGTF